MRRRAARLARLACVAAFCLAALPAPCDRASGALPAASPGTAPSRGRIETEERGGIPISRRSYDEGGALLEESFFALDGKVRERRRYLRIGGRLARVEALDAEGKLLGTIDYRYDGSGRLVGISPTGSLGSGSVGMIASGPSPSGTWASFGTSVTVQRLDERGRPLRIETLSKGKTMARRSYEYGEGGLPARLEEEDLAAGLSILSDFDLQGRILLKVERLKGVERSRSEYRYDAAGRLLEERSRKRAALVLRSLAYDEGGALAREETRTDGIITGAIEYRGELKIIERYHEGLLFVRTSYASGRKVKDEFFEDGTAIRAKEYP
jgi:hypothetical protein